MSRPRFTRRGLLAGLGGTAAAVTGGVLAPGWRGAVAAGAPKRLAIIYSGNGTIKPSLLSSRDRLELGPILAPLTPYLDDLVVVDGLTIHAGGPAGNPHHLGFGCLLTGTHLINGQYLDNLGNYYGSHGGPSIDQVIADELAPPTPYRTLEIGVQSGKLYPSTSMSKLAARGPGQLLPAESDPFRLFDRVYGGSRSPTELAALRGEQASVLDFARRDLERLQPRLSSAERGRLGAHLEAVRSIERRLQAPRPDCAPFDPGAPFDVWANDAFPEVTELQLDMLATAFACDQTRVATFMVSESGSQTVYSWLGITQGHHDISHAGDSDLVAQNNLVAINTWVAERIAGFAERLKALPDVEGSVYDNTLIVWVNDLGKGNEHTLTDVTFVLLGGAGGAIAGSQHLTYDGRRHNDLLLTVAHAMGANLSQFGDEEANRGPMNEILA